MKKRFIRKLEVSDLLKIKFHFLKYFQQMESEVLYRIDIATESLNKMHFQFLLR